MTEATSNVPAGWYIDPEGSAQLRWWDGSAWTSHYTPNVVADAPAQQTVRVAAAEVPARQTQDAYGQFGSGQSNWTQPAYDQSASGQGAQEQSTFGQSRFGQSTAYGQSAFGQPTNGYSPFGQSTAGQGAYGQTNHGYAQRPITAAPRLTFGESIVTVFRKYADFSGVASRSEYWWWYLFSTVVTMLLYVPMYSTDPAIMLPASLVMLVWALGTFLPRFAVTVRRLRDTGRSWLYLLWGFIPFGGIVLIVFFCQASTGYAGGGAGRR
ncbi:DUF805 domain-containing protein [Leifsonia sp. YAF41]|uniref:DUF805 domain-containing protein n=1 Tax=Leifsonia sp. YAF41 TaxID=3233086 RepID=UPI003F9C8E8E